VLLIGRMLCFAAVVVLLFGRMLCRLGGLGGCFATFVVLLIFACLVLQYLLAGSVMVVSRFVGSSMCFLFFLVVLFCHTGRLPLAWWCSLIASAY
jgi:hypothetical protein